MDDDDDDDSGEPGGHEFSRGIVWGFFEQAEGTFREMEEAMCVLRSFRGFFDFLRGWMLMFDSAFFDSFAFSSTVCLFRTHHRYQTVTFPFDMSDLFANIRRLCIKPDFSCDGPACLIGHTFAREP